MWVKFEANEVILYADGKKRPLDWRLTIRAWPIELAIDVRLTVLDRQHPRGE